MATKKKTGVSKKQRLSTAQPRSYSELYKDDKTRPTQVSAAPISKTLTPQTSPSSVQTLNWREEYAYVVHDLRTLLIVSAVLFAIIIITGFFV